MFQQGAQETVWRQARASFTASPGEPFVPQLAGCADFVIKVPPVPNSGSDPGLIDVWDQGTWDNAKWDQEATGKSVMRNTMWVSIGITGFTLAPVMQVTVAQQAKPSVEFIALDCAYERAGVNV
jgi:hypothetical protein